MKDLVAWLGTPVGRFIRDLVEGAIAGAIAAVVALQLDVATPSDPRCRPDRGSRRRHRRGATRDRELGLAGGANAALTSRVGWEGDLLTRQMHLSYDLAE